jgi:predicted DNA-binding transcriptional regulator AlpA
MPTEKQLSPLFVPYKMLPEVIGVTYSRVHIRELVLAGQFPEPFQMSPRRIAWRHSDLVEWAAQRELRNKCLTAARAKKMAKRRESARSNLRKSVTRVLIEGDEERRVGS